MLIAFGSLPGSGKSSIAHGLGRETGAMWLRIDSIEHAIRESGIVAGSIDDAGYRAAYAIADDDLHLGRNVIGELCERLVGDAKCVARHRRAGWLNS